MEKFVIIDGVKHHINHIPKKKLKKPEKSVNLPKKVKVIEPEK